MQPVLHAVGAQLCSAVLWGCWWDAAGHPNPVMTCAACAGVCSSKQAGSPTFGPYGQCQGNRFPYQQCTLKNSANNLLEVYEQGELQPWTSGTLFTPTNVKYD